MTSPLFVDGIPIGAAVAAKAAKAQTTALPVSRDSTDRFWSTPPREQAGEVHDILQITFGGERLVNYIALEIAHFPHEVWPEYLDEGTGQWTRFTSQPVTAGTSAPPARYAVLDSVPLRVNRVSGVPGEHPQHYGPGHWLPISWRVRPREVRQVRLVFVRLPGGTPPVDPLGRPVPYSLGARSVQFGYRINSKADVPRYGNVTTYEEDFASATDYLGSRVVFSLYEQSPRRVLGEAGMDRSWRSNPMPVNYAVVCFYADTRDAAGQPQIIDRWFVDPTTVGCHCNLYYSNDEPDSEVHFRASDTPLEYPIAQAHGTSATAHKFPQSHEFTAIGFSHAFASYIDIDNGFVQFDPTKSWWLGLEIDSWAWGSDGTTYDGGPVLDRPLLSFGDNVLLATVGEVRFSTEHGEIASVPFAPSFTWGSIWKLVVIYNPEATEEYPAGLTLVFQIGDNAPAVVSTAVSRLAGRPATIRLGGFPDTNSPGIPGIRMRALIVKTTEAGPEDIATFLAAPQDYVRRTPYEDDDLGTTDDSILRLEPWRANPATGSPGIGLFGGMGDRYESMVWTPIGRDYTLRKGFLQLPPTRAKYWKFEFTRLVPEPYESFVPITHDVRVFTSETVRQFTQMSAGPSANPRDVGPGTPTALALSEINRYADAIGALRGLPSLLAHTATEALHANNLTEAARIEAFGWVWAFQPWHIGSSAPRFTTKTTHVYEHIAVTRRTKVGWFAGLRHLTAYRLDYLASDDTAQYLDYFDDLHWVDTSLGMELRDGALVSLSAAGEAISKGFGSYRQVRAVQIATQQSDPYQILPDDRFAAESLSDYWDPYGDAQLTHGDRQVQVGRGWYARTYGGLETEAAYTLYSGAEGRRYAEIEGALPDGVAGGGVQSHPVSPSRGGRLYAAVQVASDQATTAPVVVQIISTNGDVVLAQESRDLVPGETIKFYVGYTPGPPTAVPMPGVVGADPSFESGVNGATYSGFFGGPAPSATTSALYPTDGAQSLEIAWGYGTGNNQGLVSWTLTGLTVGETYQVLLDCWVPSGAPNVQLGVGGVSFGTTRSTKDAQMTMSFTWTATGTSHQVQLVSQPSTAAGQKCYVDLLRVTRVSRYYSDLEGDLYSTVEGTLYGDHEAGSYVGDVYVRAAQITPTQDTWTVSRLSLFDDPVQWSFSVDDGATWWDANEIRNNPRGVLTVPNPGTTLRWRVRIWQAGAWVSALAIRPWYGGLLSGVPGTHGRSVSGPNSSVVDQFPAVENDPMWRQWDKPIPRWWYNPLAVGPVPAPAPEPDAPDAPAAVTNYPRYYEATYQATDPTYYPATYQATY